MDNATYATQANLTLAKNQLTSANIQLATAALYEDLKIIVKWSRLTVTSLLA